MLGQFMVSQLLGEAVFGVAGSQPSHTKICISAPIASWNVRIT